MNKILSTEGTTNFLSCRMDVHKRDGHFKSELNEISRSLELYNLQVWSMESTPGLPDWKFDGHHNVFTIYTESKEFNKVKGALKLPTRIYHPLLSLKLGSWSSGCKLSIAAPWEQVEASLLSLWAASAPLWIQGLSCLAWQGYQQENKFLRTTVGPRNQSPKFHHSIPPCILLTSFRTQPQHDWPLQHGLCWEDQQQAVYLLTLWMKAHLCWFIIIRWFRSSNPASDNV